MRFLVRFFLALRITHLEARIAELREGLARDAEALDHARRAVNLAHQSFAALDGRHRPSVYQLRSGR